MATHCLDVWEWEGGAGGAGEIGIDPHATGREHPAVARGIWPGARWASFALLGAGLLAFGLRERARSGGR
jgi:hypothetical protein